MLLPVILFAVGASSMMIHPMKETSKINDSVPLITALIDRMKDMLDDINAIQEETVKQGCQKSNLLLQEEDPVHTLRDSHILKATDGCWSDNMNRSFPYGAKGYYQCVGVECKSDTNWGPTGEVIPNCSPESFACWNLMTNEEVSIGSTMFYECNQYLCSEDDWVPNGVRDPSCDHNWSLVRNACIKGNNYKHIPRVTIDVCKENCINELGSRCQSIDYHPSSKLCYISEMQSNSDDYTEPCYFGGDWIYTEIIPNADNWSLVRDACIKGNNYKQFRRVTIDVCKENCINELGSRCQSIDYQPSAELCNISEMQSNSDDYTEPCYIFGFQYTEILPNAGP